MPFFSGAFFVFITALNNTKMKTFGRLSVVVLVLSGWIASYGQVIESEVPGDNFSLEGALELFKKSASPEEFEKLLNSPDSKVNNLDLNGDGYIDYIRVFDRYEGNVHAFILQAVVSEKESQDIAVIELEKLANGKAVLQIIGDEDIYGVETIIEPTREVRTYAGTTTSRTVVNVWAWPSVQYIYGPYYAGWFSPWGWHLRPVWWHTWRPVAYVHYYPIWRPYRPYYVACHTHRVAYAHHIYRPYRTTSVVVHNRHRAQVADYRSARHDDYRNGRTRDNDGQSYGRQNPRSDRTSITGRQRTEYNQANNNNNRSSTGNIQQQRKEVDVNRRSSVQREGVTSPNFSTSRERSAPAKFQRNSTELNNVPNRNSGTIQNNSRETRQPVAKPAPMDRSNSSESPNVQQRSTTRERSTPDIQRNSTGVKRDNFLKGSSGTIHGNRETRQQVTRPATINKSRSSESPNVQQRSGSGNRSGVTKPSKIKRD
jgi:hypothetical protein